MGRLLGVGLLLGLFSLGSMAQAADVRTNHVHFARGASAATLHGHVVGRDSVHYLLAVRAGQMLRVVLHGGDGAVAFNVFEPGHVPGRDGALYVGEHNGPRMEVRTAHDGEYLIQVFLNRAAARRGERANYSLDIAVTGGAAQAASPAARPGDAVVPGTHFHATGMIPCSRQQSGPMQQCRFGVERQRGKGNAAVTVFWPDGGSRVIYFEDLTPVRYDESQADGGARLTVRMEGDIFHIRVGSQRFEMVPAIIEGG
jgi:hypothetical protein